MAEDPRMSNNVGRVKCEREIDLALQAWTLSLDAADALENLADADVPAGPINSIREIAEDPHFIARGAFEAVTVDDEVRHLPAVHPKLDVTPALTRWPGPELGEHTIEVLRDWLAASDVEIETWRTSNIL